MTNSKLSANSVQHAPNTAAVPATIDAAALPNSRHELFAQNVAAGHSLADAYRGAGYGDLQPAVVWACASRLASSHAVQARIRALRDAAAAHAVISIASRISWLDAVVHADRYELERVVACLCSECWPDDQTYATAVQRYLASLGTPAALPPPDISAPRVDCHRGPHQRIETTNTADLSGNARAAYRGARYRPDGSIEVLMEDRQSASDQLNKMQAVYVSKSLNISATLNVPALKDVTTDQALAMLESFK